MQTVTPSLSSPLDNNISENMTPNQKPGIKKILLYSFLVISILILLYNAYLHFFQNTDILEKHFGIQISQYFQTTKVGVNKFLEGTKDTIDIKNKNLTKNKVHKFNNDSPIEKRSDISNKKMTDLEKIDSESSFDSSLKKSKKNGQFCYIGTDKRHRHCVKMQPGDVCASNKVFPTRDICINPNLK